MGSLDNHIQIRTLLTATCHVNPHPHSQANQGVEWEVHAIHPQALELTTEDKDVVLDSVVGMLKDKGMGMDTGMGMDMVMGMDMSTSTSMVMGMDMASMGKNMERASILEAALAVILIRLHEETTHGSCTLSTWHTTQNKQPHTEQLVNILRCF